jgi:hypothetical protein
MSSEVLIGIAKGLIAAGVLAALVALVLLVRAIMKWIRRGQMKRP